MNQSKCDVLIVGAGPTGLMLAIQLASMGVSFCIIDKKEHISTIMKATAISSVALEGFDDLGYAQAFEDTGVFTHALSIYAENKQVLHIPWVGIESKYPAYCLLGQNYVEKFQQQILNDHGYFVAWETEFISYQSESDHLVANIRTNGETTSVNCQYIVGCDGTRSQVRACADIPLKGKQYPQRYVIADVMLEGNFDRNDWYFFLAKHGFSSVGALPGNRWGVLLSLPKQQKYAQGEQPSLADVQALFDQVSDIPARLTDPNWISHFHTYLKYVPTRQKDRVFLCGDAAHQVSPLTSLGMNSGMLDANNLAWKLALVCQGKSFPSLLKTYSVEQKQTIKDAQRLSNANEFSFSMTGILSREIRDHMTQLALGFEPVMRYFSGVLSQTSIAFKHSPIIDEFIGFPMHRNQEAYHLSSKTSCLKAWSDFGKGIKPGQRAPNVFGLRNNEHPQGWLFDQKLQGKHALFVFLGTDPINSTKLSLIETLLETVKQEYGQMLKCIVIGANKVDIQQVRCQEIVLFDETGLAHQRYGATGDCLYLIRPDRFVAYRSLPPRLDKLQMFLKQVFDSST